MSDVPPPPEQPKEAPTRCSVRYLSLRIVIILELTNKLILLSFHQYIDLARG